MHYCIPFHLTLNIKSSIVRRTAVKSRSLVGLSLLSPAGSLTCLTGRGEVIVMSMVWIGLVVILSVGMFLTLALCRSAALADRGIDVYMVHEDQVEPASPEQERTTLQVQ